MEIYCCDWSTSHVPILLCCIMIFTINAFCKRYWGNGNPGKDWDQYCNRLEFWQKTWRTEENCNYSDPREGHHLVVFSTDYWSKVWRETLQAGYILKKKKEASIWTVTNRDCLFISVGLYVCMSILWGHTHTHTHTHTHIYIYIYICVCVCVCVYVCPHEILCDFGIKANHQIMAKRLDRVVSSKRKQTNQTSSFHLFTSLNKGKAKNYIDSGNLPES